MRHLAVFPERLAVIAGRDDQRRARGAAFDQGLQQRSQRRIGYRDFTEIGRARKPRCVRLRRLIRKMRLVEVHPHKPRRRPALLLHPRERCRNGVGAAALRDAKRGVRLGLRKPIVVAVESARQAESRVKRKRADERGGAVPACLEQRRQRRHVGREPEPCVLADAVAERIDARENVRMRWQRDDGGGVRGGEADAAGGEAIEPRRGRGLVAVRPNRVRAQGVNRDEEDVLRGIATY